MPKSHPRVLEAALYVLIVASLFTVTAACGPASPFAPFFDDDGGGGGSTSVEFTFHLPADGATVGAVTTLSVSGSGLTKAEFYVDGILVFRDEEDSFEWELDPAEFVLGEHELQVVGYDSEDRWDTASAGVTLERAVPLATILQAIEDLPASHWYAIPNSRLRAVGWSSTDDERGTG